MILAGNKATEWGRTKDDLKGGLPRKVPSSDSCKKERTKERKKERSDADATYFDNDVIVNKDNVGSKSS